MRSRVPFLALLVISALGITAYAQSRPTRVEPLQGKQTTATKTSTTTSPSTTPPTGSTGSTDGTIGSSSTGSSTSSTTSSTAPTGTSSTSSNGITTTTGSTGSGTSLTGSSHHDVEPSFWADVFNRQLAKSIVGTVVFFCVALVLLAVAVWFIDLVTPGNLAEQLLGKGTVDSKPNLALAVFAGCMFFGICVVIAAVSH